jgi:hypothetical protein
MASTSIATGPLFSLFFLLPLLMRLIDEKV